MTLTYPKPQLADHYDPTLERRCTDCLFGTVYTHDPQETHYCETCGGAGYLLTDEGKQLVGFMHRHLHALPPPTTWLNAASRAGSNAAQMTLDLHELENDGDYIPF